MEAFIGTIQPFGFNFAPRAWSKCSGQLIAISSDSAMFALLGTMYGGDGRTTFGLPNLNGRTAVGVGQAPGTSLHWSQGLDYGNDVKALSVAQMPAHSHPATFKENPSSSGLYATTSEGDLVTPQEGAFLAKPTPGPSPADQPEKIFRSSEGQGFARLGGLMLSGQVDVGIEGLGAAFSIVQPSLAVNYCISRQGLFPSRN